MDFEDDLFARDAKRFYKPAITMEKLCIIAGCSNLEMPCNLPVLRDRPLAAAAQLPTHRVRIYLAVAAANFYRLTSRLQCGCLCVFTQIFCSAGHVGLEGYSNPQGLVSKGLHCRGFFFCSYGHVGYLDLQQTSRARAVDCE